MTTPQGMLELADELQRLCCAETEGKFFDCVTDNISTIILALRQAAAPEGREADKNNADIATMRKRDDDLARAKSISWDDVSVDRPQPDALTPAVAPDGGAMRATLAGFIEAFDSGAVQLSSAEIDASDEHPPYPCMAYGVDQPSQSRPRPPSAGPG